MNAYTHNIALTHTRTYINMYTNKTTYTNLNSPD